MASLAELSALGLQVRASVHEARPVLIGIVGPPGSGKSTLTEHLARATGWSILQMDGYHFANEVLLALGRRDRKGSPDTFDVDGFIALLKRVRAAETSVVYAPRFVREIEEPVGSAMPVACDVASGVLVEGNYLLHDQYGWADVAPLLDEIWYVDTPSDVCRERLLERATATYGPVKGPQWVESVDMPNAVVVGSGAARAHRRVVLDLQS